MRSGFTSDLEIECRRPDSPIRDYIDAEIEVASDVRRRRAQWMLADGVVLRSHDFGAGNSLTATNQTAALTLANAPAGNALYEVHYKVVINPVVPGGGTNKHKVVVAIETRPAAGAWTERAVLQYDVARTAGQTATPVTWGHELIEVRVAGMTSTHEIRLRIKASSGPGGWSFAVHGFNVATNGDPTQGVTYFTGLAVDFPKDGGVALADTIQTILDNAVSDGYMTDLGGPPNQGAAAPYFVTRINWTGTGAQPRGTPFDRVVAFLNPRVDGGQPRNVAYWVCQPFNMQVRDGMGRLYPLTPLASPITVPAQDGDTPEDIAFSWATFADADKPKITLNGNVPAVLVFVWAIQEDGTPATNVGWGQDSATSSIVSGIYRLSTARIRKDGKDWYDDGPANPVLRVRIEVGSFASPVTVPFTGAGAGSRFDLGHVPTKGVQYICRAELNGGTVVFQVRNDADSGWVTVTDGATNADLGLAANQTRKHQVTLTGAAAGDSTPVVVEFGVRELDVFPLHHCARLEQARWAVDPLQLRTETTSARVVALRDDVMGEFIDRVTTLLTNYFVGQITMRVWVGSPERPRWMHIDDFLIDDEEFDGPAVGIPCVGVTALERGIVPVFDSSVENAQPLTYANKSLKFVYDDILSKIGVSSRFLGPGIEDDATLVSKVLTESEAKSELDALNFLDGSGRITSQGRIKSARVFGPKAPVRIYSRERVRWSSVTPGYRQRQPELRIPWDWSDAEQRYRSEHKAANAAAVLRLGRARIDPPVLLPDGVTKWIPSAVLAERIGKRHVGAVGAGLMLWYFGIDTADPAIEPGDCVAVPTDLFASRDPISDRALSGELYAIGVVVATSEDYRTFALFVRSYADILGAVEAGIRLGFGSPELPEVILNVTQQGLVTAIIKGKNAQSVKFAASSAGEPTPATIRAATQQATDADGIYRSGTLLTLTAGQTGWVGAFAYEQANGTGKESLLGVCKVTHYEGGVSLDIVEKSQTSWQITYHLTARDADGDQVRIAYRTQLVASGPSESYTSPTPTYDPSSNYGSQPRGLDLVLDKTFGAPRWLECWAEDENGNKGPIVRALLPEITSSDAETAVSGLSISPFFNACGAGSPGLHDSISWSKAAPASFTHRIFSCGGSGCSLPGTQVGSDNPTSPIDRFLITFHKSGVAQNNFRKYRVTCVNSYGDAVDTDDSSEFNTQTVTCP